MVDLNTETSTAPLPVDSRYDGGKLPESDHRSSIRDSLNKAFEQHGVDPRIGRERDDKPERETREATEEKRPAIGEAEDDESLEASTADDHSKDRDVDRSANSSLEEEADETVEEKKFIAPKSWSKEAKETWDTLPERVRAEITKRETDMEKGVKAIKDKWAKYEGIDEAFAPFEDTLNDFQKTPKEAVSQLFSWFKALAENPRQAFPALINSYKMDPRMIVEAYWPGALQRYTQMENYIKSLPQNQQPQNNQQQQNPQQQQQNQQWQQYTQQLEQRFRQLEERNQQLEGVVGQRFSAQDQMYQQQNAARTSEYLDQWAKDKPYFDKVRMKMGYLLTPDAQGNAIVPLRDGKVDLDEAYNQAVWMDPEIRSMLQEEQRLERIAKAKAKREAAEKAAQADADRARKASVSLTGGAPSGEIGRKPIAPKGLSVRDSLKAAIADLSGR